MINIIDWIKNRRAAKADAQQSKPAPILVQAMERHEKASSELLRALHELELAIEASRTKKDGNG